MGFLYKYDEERRRGGGACICKVSLMHHHTLRGVWCVCGDRLSVECGASADKHVVRVSAVCGQAGAFSRSCPRPIYSYPFFYLWHCTNPHTHTHTHHFTKCLRHILFIEDTCLEGTCCFSFLSTWQRSHHSVCLCVMKQDEEFIFALCLAWLLPSTHSHRHT